MPAKQQSKKRASKTTEKKTKPAPKDTFVKAVVKLATSKKKKESVLSKQNNEEDQALNENKRHIIEQYQLTQSDTGSPEVQIALLSARIDKLIMHLKSNPADNHSRRGLLGIVSKRRRLLNYLEDKDRSRFSDIAKKLELTK